MPPVSAADLDRPVFLHPGQGTQRVGMGRWLYQASPMALDILDRVASATGADLARLMARGPAAALDDTRHAQPAIFATNLAAEAVLSEHGIRPVAVAGHSSGEMSALVTAGVLELDAAARLVAVRCSLMAGAPPGGAMGAVSGLSAAAVEALCAEVASGEPLVVALENAPRHVVVSGGASAVAACLAAAGRAGAVRSMPLRTSNAFHSPLMAGCAPAWAEAVAATEFRSPTIPIVLGSCGMALSDPDGIRAAVAAQLTSRVRWSGVMDTIRAAEPSAYVECGASRFLVSLVRAEDRAAATLSMDSERIRSAIGVPA